MRRAFFAFVALILSAVLSAGCNPTDDTPSRPANDTGSDLSSSDLSDSPSEEPDSETSSTADSSDSDSVGSTGSSSRPAVPAASRPGGSSGPPSIPKTEKSVNIRNYGAKGDGKSDDAGALKKALAAVAQKGNVILPRGRYRMESSLTVPENAVLTLESGAVITVGNKADFTINGWVDAPPVKIFEGKVRGSIRGKGYPQWFGARGNGNDDTSAFQAAADVLSFLEVPHTGGTYLLGTVFLNRSVTVSGAGSTRVSLQAKSERLFAVRADNVIIENFSVTGLEHAVQTIVYLDNSSKGLQKITVRNLSVLRSGSVVSDTGKTDRPLKNVTLHGIMQTAPYGTGIRLTSGSEGLRITDVIIDAVPSARVTVPLMRIENAKNAVLNDVDVAGGFGKGTGGDGLILKNCSGITSTRFMADYVNGYGAKLIGCTRLNLQNWVASLYEDGAFSLENVSDSRFKLLKLNGIAGAATSSHAGTALVLKNCKNNEFLGAVLQHNLSHAMAVENSTDNTFRNFMIFSNQGNGYTESGSGNRNTLIGAVFRSNTGGCRQTGAQSRMTACSINGKFYDSITGAFSS